MLTKFGFVLLFITTGALFVGIALFVSKLIRPDRPNTVKLMTYDENDPGFLKHDAFEIDPTLQLALARMEIPDLPVAVGIIRQAEKSSYAVVLHENLNRLRQSSEFKTVHDLFHTGNTWQV